MTAVLTDGREPSTGLIRRSLAEVTDKGIFAITILLVAVAVVSVQGFATLPNVVTVLHSTAAIGVVAVGMTFVVISANYIDLSVVGQVATAGVAVMALSQFGPAVGILAGLGLCLVFGFVNGLAIGVLRANAVVVTLGTNGIGIGLLLLVTKGHIYYGSATAAVATFGAAAIGPIPLAAIVLLVVVIIAQFVLTKTTFGFSVRSIGSNREAARLAGVHNSWIVIGAFLTSSICCAISGFILASFSNTAVATMSSGYDFSSLAAVIVGGTSLFGGRGSIIRTLVGVIFIAVVGNFLVLVGFSYEWQRFVTGVIIVVAVAVDALSKKVGLR